MNRVILTILLSFCLLCWVGCSKDEDKVAELEQEVMDAESQDVLADTTAGEGVTEPEQETAEGYAMAEEEPAKSYEPSATGGFTVQVGAGTNEVNADYLAEKFINRGYEAFITRVYIDDVLHYRVRVGNYETFEQAKEIGMEIKDKYSIDFWIDNNI